MLSLLKVVDQKKLIALLQAGALDDALSTDAHCERLAKVVQKTIYPLLSRDDRACGMQRTLVIQIGPLLSESSCSSLLTLPPKPSLFSMHARTIP